MPKEIKILIPETGAEETVDIKVMSSEKKLVNYRLEVFSYPDGKTDQSRADFVKECIDTYDASYDVVEIGLDGENLIPVLFRELEK
jgi:hypothetical protein